MPTERQPILEVKYVRTNTLIPLDDNPRTISEEDFKRLCDSLRANPDYLTVRPLLITPENVVFAGNMRLKAAQHIGMEEVPVAVMDIPEERRRELTIRDNVNNGSWDPDVLNNAWDAESLMEWGVDIEEFGVDEGGGAQTADAPAQMDRAEELNEIWGVSLGDIWEIGDHKLLCGDSTSLDCVRRIVGSEKSDMVWIDPPYGVSYTDSNGMTIENDELTGEELQEFLRKSFECAVQNAKPTAPWYVWHASRYQREFENALNAVGVSVKEQIIWVKGEGREGTSGVNAPAIGRSDWRWLHEPCFYAAVEGESVFNLGDRTTTTVWTVTLDTTGRIHPTEKPLGVAELPIKNSSKRGDVVYDGFCGSGTSMLACQNLARKCRAIELNPKYCAVILERMKNAFSITGIKLSHA